MSKALGKLLETSAHSAAARHRFHLAAEQAREALDPARIGSNAILATRDRWAETRARSLTLARRHPMAAAAATLTVAAIGFGLIRGRVSRLASEWGLWGRNQHCEEDDVP